MPRPAGRPAGGGPGPVRSGGPGGEIPAGRRVTGRRGPAASASSAGRRPAGLAREGLKPRSPQRSSPSGSTPWSSPSGSCSRCASPAASGQVSPAPRRRRVGPDRSARRRRRRGSRHQKQWRSRRRSPARRPRQPIGPANSSNSTGALGNGSTSGRGATRVRRGSLLAGASRRVRRLRCSPPSPGPRRSRRRRPPARGAGLTGRVRVGPPPAAPVPRPHPEGHVGVALVQGPVDPELLVVGPDDGPDPLAGLEGGAPVARVGVCPRGDPAGVRTGRESAVDMVECSSRRVAPRPSCPAVGAIACSVAKFIGRGAGRVQRRPQGRIDRPPRFTV